MSFDQMGWVFCLVLMTLFWAGRAWEWFWRRRGYRISFLVMPPDTARRFAALKRLTESTSDSVVIVRALAWYDLLLREQTAGKMVLIFDPETGDALHPDLT